MNFDERQEFIHKLLELCRNDKLSINQKKALFDIVNNFDRTDKQKERFIKYYNLDINSQRKYNYTQLGSEYGCSGEAIKCSIHSVITYNLLNSKTTKQLVDLLKEK